MVKPRISHTGIFERLGDFGKAVGGAVAIYVAFAGVALMGALVLAFDVGRLVVVRSQMQNAADAACLSAAIQLDGQAGAITRATAVARNAALPTSKFAVTSGTSAITIAADPNGLVFYTNNTKATTTTDDATAFVLQVTLDTRPVTLLLQPAFAVWGGGTILDFSNVSATASCTSAPIICNPPAFFACNVATTAPYNTDLTAVSSAGIQIQLRPPGAGAVATPGNFGLVLPVDSFGANEVKNALAAVDSGECVGTNITTSPGVEAGPANAGINSRFDEGSAKNPAENIVAYPLDSSFISNYIGNGNWDRDTYWVTAHAENSGPDFHVGTFHGGVVPTAAPAAISDFTRYQTYLYELGVEFAVNANACDGSPPIGTTNSDCRTIYPIPTGGLEADDVAAGFATINPPLFPNPITGVGDDGDIPADNQTAPSPNPADPRRRVFKVAVVDDCSTASTSGGPVQGQTDINFTEFDVVEMFITEPAGAPSDFVIYLEVMEFIGTADSLDLIANARLID